MSTIEGSSFHAILQNAGCVRSCLISQPDSHSSLSGEDERAVAGTWICETMRCASGTKCYAEEYILKSRNGFRPTRVPPLFVVRELPPPLLFDYEPRRSHSRRRRSLHADLAAKTFGLYFRRSSMEDRDPYCMRWEQVYFIFLIVQFDSSHRILVYCSEGRFGRRQTP
ncbi:hypothetical protein ARMGADRAFT_81943 [Armillaria gallica]|uniref:Uncharacterized protein n=1 Tax=Armillaria gallica TaxID=47427 RepID=A0A2H3CEC7_ARMGA|nr:hypothetical protein ARMGADRAFT_81943 [Armillaria gallica]